MNGVLTVILSMSLSGGIVIIMLYLVLLLFGKKLCRQWQYYIWLLAIFRLLLPFAPQQNLMNELFRSAEQPTSGIEDLSLEGSQSGQPPTEGFKTDVIQSEDIEDEKGNIRSSGKPYGLSDAIRQCLWLIWLLPAIILFARKIMTYKKTLQYIRAGSKEVQDIVMLEEFGRLLEKDHVKGRIMLSVNNRIMSPVMIGLSDPCIILPTTQMTALEFRHTISHELVHYRRRDVLYKWLVQFAVCIHWFNPLLYMMERSISRACELSCDEAVIWDLDEQERYAYGDTLLRAAGRSVKCRLPASPIAFSNSKKKLKERLDAIMNFKKVSKATYIMMFFLTMILFVLSSYVGVYAAIRQDVAAAGTSKTKTSASRSAQEPHSVIYKSGEYFILFDDAGEKDLPSSTGPDYGVTFGAVWPDTYVSFDSYHVNKKLSSKIKKECEHMQNKGWLTKKEANAIIDVAFRVQQGDTNGFKTEKQEKEYTKWDITIKNGVYYYKKKRICILMDTRKDRSFQNFSYDKKGKVDIKVIRDSDDKIIKVRYMSKKKAREILEDLK